MTLPIGNRTDATGNNSTADYDYTFRILDETDLVITVINPDDGTETDLDLTDDYTVDGVGDVGGGQISLVDDGQEWLDEDGFLDDGWDIVLRRVRPLTQETDIRNQGDYYPEGIEDEFDSLVMMAQQLQEQIDRCVQAGVGATSPSLAELNAAVASAVAAAAQAVAAAAVTLAASLASQSDAETGTNNTKFMSPLRVDQAIQARKIRVVTGAIATGAVAINAAVCDVVNLTADGDFTLNIPTGGQAGQRVSLRITQDNPGSRILALHANFLIASELSTDGVVLSTAAGSIDEIGLYCVDGTVWEVEAFGTDYAVA
jgi:hypothetical protein